jgi:hypothetical protein
MEPAFKIGYLQLPEKNKLILLPDMSIVGPVDREGAGDSSGIIQQSTNGLG